MTKRSIILGFFLFLLIFPFACKTEIQMKGIDLKITFSEDELSENLLTNMEYNWKTNDKFEEINQDMSVYVQSMHIKERSIFLFLSMNLPLLSRNMQI